MWGYKIPWCGGSCQVVTLMVRVWRLLRLVVHLRILSMGGYESHFPAKVIGCLWGVWHVTFKPMSLERRVFFEELPLCDNPSGLIWSFGDNLRVPRGLNFEVYCRLLALRRYCENHPFFSNKNIGEKAYKHNRCFNLMYGTFSWDGEKWKESVIIFY